MNLTLLNHPQLGLSIVSVDKLFATEQRKEAWLGHIYLLKLANGEALTCHEKFLTGSIGGVSLMVIDNLLTLVMPSVHIRIKNHKLQANFLGQNISPLEKKLGEEFVSLNKGYGLL